MNHVKLMRAIEELIDAKIDTATCSAARSDTGGNAAYYQALDWEVKVRGELIAELKSLVAEITPELR